MDLENSFGCLIGQYSVHFHVRFGGVAVYCTIKNRQKGCFNVMYQKKKKKTLKGLFVLVYMQCVFLMASCYLIAAVANV